MKLFPEQIELLAQGEITICLQGWPGSGKSTLARIISEKLMESGLTLSRVETYADRPPKEIFKIKAVETRSGSRPMPA